MLELSWYGDEPTTVSLGGSFHSGRLALRASQVGRVAPARRDRRTTAHRLALALELLRDDAFDCLLTGESPFEDAARGDAAARLPRAAGAVPRGHLRQARGGPVFGVTVRDHMMVAHSLRGEVFGPAQRAARRDLRRRRDASAARTSTTTGSSSTSAGRPRRSRRSCGTLSYRNLDEEPVFAGTNTTTEVLARHVADRLAERIAAGDLGPADHVDRHWS